MAAAELGPKLALLVFSFCCISASAYLQRAAGLESNEVLVPEELQEEQDHKLPWCETHGACGMVQANSYGIHHISFCRCRGRKGCSRSWDPFDGHSITQVGSNQFKFCERAPEVAPCSIDELTYENTFVYSKLTGVTMKSQHRILCQCPETSAIERVDDSTLETETLGGVIIKFTCVPMKVCKKDAECKTVAIFRQGVDVSVFCKCPRPYSCPTITNQVMRTSDMGKGKVDFIQCQDE